jgi:peptidoglycan/xylan/chitin deacetylase (PgdA/CDA1 family)
VDATLLESPTIGESGAVAPEDRAVYLTFHGIGETKRPLAAGEAAVWLSRDAFTAALDVVADDPRVRLTFDDANLSDVAIALPALLARGLTATFFLPAGFVGRPGRLDAARVRALAAAGMTIGSHGMHHRAWRRLPPAAAFEETVVARDILERTAGAPVRDAACPFGEYDRASLQSLRAAGFNRIYTSDGGPARPGTWLRPRTTVRCGHDADDVRRIVDRAAGAASGVVSGLRMTVKRWR